MTLIASDTFNRADSTSTMGSADVGGSWSTHGHLVTPSPWGIDSNKAYAVNVSDIVFNYIYEVPMFLATVGSSDEGHDVQADLSLSSGNAQVGVVAKFVDTDNWLAAVLFDTTARSSTVVRCEAGVVSSVGSGIAPVRGTTYTVRFVVDQTTWSFYVNGTLNMTGMLTAGEQANASTPASAGLYLASGQYAYVGGPRNDTGDSRFDNFTFNSFPYRKSGFRHVGLVRGARG